MNTLEAIDKMVDISGSSKSGISRAMGRHRNFISTTISKNSEPQVDTLAEIADATGFKLVLEGHGVKIEIDPPKE